MKAPKPKPRKQSARAALIEDFCGLERAVSWSARDKANLANFLGTQTGERFANILRNIAMRNTQMCVWENAKFSPDYARGQQQLFGEILNLSAISPQQLAELSEGSLTDNDNEQPEPDQQTEEPSDQLYGYGGSSIGY